MFFCQILSEHHLVELFCQDALPGNNAHLKFTKAPAWSIQRSVSTRDNSFSKRAVVAKRRRQISWTMETYWSKSIL
jgi:hypothetical protein